MHQLVTALAPMTSLNYLDLSITDLMAEPKADHSRADLHLAPLPSIRQLTVNADTEDSLQLKRRIDAYGVNRLFPNALAGVIIRYIRALPPYVLEEFEVFQQAMMEAFPGLDEAERMIDFEFHFFHHEQHHLD